MSQLCSAQKEPSGSSEELISRCCGLCLALRLQPTSDSLHSIVGVVHVYQTSQVGQVLSSATIHSGTAITFIEGERLSKDEATSSRAHSVIFSFLDSSASDLGISICGKHCSKQRRVIEAFNTRLCDICGKFCHPSRRLSALSTFCSTETVLRVACRKNAEGEFGETAVHLTYEMTFALTQIWEP